MLKTFQNPFGITENLVLNSKYAEIHYLTENFRIICQRCKDIFRDYQRFIKHFQDEHLHTYMSSQTM